MLRLTQSTKKTTRCAIVCAQMTYDIHSKLRRKCGRSTKKRAKKGPLKPQETQDYESKKGQSFTITIKAKQIGNTVNKHTLN